MITELDQEIIKVLTAQNSYFQKLADEKGLSELLESGKMNAIQRRVWRQKKDPLIEVIKLNKSFQSMLRRGDFHNLPEWKENFERVFKKFWEVHTLRIVKN